MIRRSRLGPRLVNCQFMNPDQHTPASLPPEGLKYIYYTHSAAKLCAGVLRYQSLSHTMETSVLKFDHPSGDHSLSFFDNRQW